MKYIRGFLMAWGMFCWIPCPYKGWREEDRKAQLAMFPLVGTFIGIVLSLIWMGLSYIGAGPIISGALLCGSYFLLTGFIHLDGFMDCSDAIMPRHPDMEQRRRILKDSHSGAFALICASLMFIIFAGAMMEIADNFSLRACAMLVVIFTTSRLMSAVAVLTCKPMSTSQYTQTSGGFKDTIPALVVAILVLGACEFVASGGSMASLVAELYTNVVALVVIVVAEVVGYKDRKKLGGMNGDISGHMLTMSEMFAVAAMALII